MPMLLFSLALGILLVYVLDRALRGYSRMSVEEARKTGFLTAGIGLALASLFSPVLRRLAMLGLLAAPWHWGRATPAGTPPAASKMNADEARDILGVSSQASREEIEEAYRRLMRLNHPDQGGSEYFAKKLNQARDILLKGKP